jgi:hypothetical protein
MKTPTIGTSLCLPGESPIQANRRLCEEAGIDTLPVKFESAIMNFHRLTREEAQEMYRTGEHPHAREHREENEDAAREQA